MRALTAPFPLGEDAKWERGEIGRARGVRRDRGGEFGRVENHWRQIWHLAPVGSYSPLPRPLLVTFSDWLLEKTSIYAKLNFICIKQSDLKVLARMHRGQRFGQVSIRKPLAVDLTPGSRGILGSLRKPPFFWLAVGQDLYINFLMSWQSNLKVLGMDAWVSERQDSVQIFNTVPRYVKCAHCTQCKYLGTVVKDLCRVLFFTDPCIHAKNF